ncbi:protein REVEILLE 5-like isoform X2 [Rhodamnia argentea]|uniref:Protein REVEILLE 5-like isoform X2 n=1 Tax=Rhodamnia argentea TaxID=178133 RepID=A0A8B8N975_9MYRT|nr:protein REVEILLE 5-like isoform X2 [Rhodamnia argentea]
MVSVNANPAQGFYFFNPANMGIQGVSAGSPPPSTVAMAGSAANSASYAEDPSKKVRKPYTITKSRESWTDQEHDKFLEALHLFDRDWKKIEAFVGSKTVIQIRSHAQKYFLKVQKNGTSEHVPPPRPKRKAAHPYPQKAPKAPVVSQVNGPFQVSSAFLEPAHVGRPDGSTFLGNSLTGAALSSWSHNSVPAMSASQGAKDVRISGPPVPSNCCNSSSNDSTPRSSCNGQAIEPVDQQKHLRVMPDFAQVYRFIGSVFDPDASGHLQRLKQMDPINMETVLLLMKNLYANLTSPEFKKYQQSLFASYDGGPKKSKSGGSFNFLPEKSGSLILSA